MTRTTETAIDRYIQIFDRAAHDPERSTSSGSIFAPDAGVQLSDDQEPVTGFAALMDLYRGIAAGMADSKHIWTTTVLDDGRIEWGWVSVARGVDGRLMALSGIEHATLDASGVEPKLIEKVAWELLAGADRFTRSALIAIGGDLRAHIEATSEDLVVQTVIALTAP